ncbi:MAG: FGGY family carbohydrate kinase, partial [Atopobium minutum]|nr:FGGY family carbohydrate kinase [Atopobium minutum]
MSAAQTLYSGAGTFGQRDTREYVMSLDAGTTSVRAILFDEYGLKVAQSSRALSISYPHSGWVEQD